ncbi:hypothetical protein KEM54_000080 [Ascosphaera aggregata]|nr:hypothetical protein KEM54_000080 [Ascosphaera aggregata]
MPHPTDPPQDRLRVWKNGATVPKPVEECLQDVVSRTVRSQPDAPAVHAWDGTFSYGKLDELASKLAHRILHRHGGVGSVYVMFEKSAWASVAVLGAVKAGKPFVFLDHRMVEQRLRNKMSVPAADALILVSERFKSLAAHISQHEGIFVVDGRLDEGDGPRLPDDTVKRDPRAIAYLAFSSGKTGSRCCPIAHINICSALHYQTPFLGFKKSSRVFDLASYSSDIPPFGVDIAIHNMFATWSTGGCLCVPRQDELQNLADAMRRMDATLVQLPPHACRAIRPDTVPTLKTLVVVGNLQGKDDIEEWWQKVQIIRANGPIECTAYAAINYEHRSLYELQSIGFPKGCNIWIASSRGLLVPWGQEGELLIEGPIVGRGYLHNPDLTRKRFVHNIKWLERGAFGIKGRKSRIYRTGDIGKYDSKGNLFITGRAPAS